MADLTYEDILKQQLNNLGNPNRATNLVNMVNNATPEAKPTESFGAKHPFINTAGKSLLGAGLGALVGDDLNDVLTGMAIGGMYGWTDAQKARKQWEGGINEHNEKLRQELMRIYSPANEALALNRLKDPAQAVGQDQFARNTLNKGGFGYMNPSSGIMSKDTTNQAFDIAGNTQMSQNFPDYVDSMNGANQSGFEGIAKVSRLTPDQVQNDQLINNYKESRNYIDGLGGFDRVKQLISDNTLNPDDRKVLQDKLTQHLNIYNQVQKNGLMDQANTVKGNVSETPPVFVPVKDQVDMGKNINNAYYQGEQAGNTYLKNTGELGEKNRHNLTTEKETNRYHTATTGENSRYHNITTGETHRHNIVQENKPTKGEGPDVKVNKDIVNIQSDLQNNGGFKPEAAELHAQYISARKQGRYSPEQLQVLRQRIQAKTGVDPEQSIQYLQKQPKNKNSNSSFNIDSNMFK